TRRTCDSSSPSARRVRKRVPRFSFSTERRTFSFSSIVILKPHRASHPARAQPLVISSPSTSLRTGSIEESLTVQEIFRDVSTSLDMTKKEYLHWYAQCLVG